MDLLMNTTFYSVLWWTPGSAHDSLPPHQKRGVWPPLSHRVLRPQRGHLLPRHPHREDVQGLPGQDGREDQVLEETLVRLWPPQKDALLLRWWEEAVAFVFFCFFCSLSFVNKFHPSVSPASEQSRWSFNRIDGVGRWFSLEDYFYFL